MENDLILNKFFEMPRWEYAIHKGFNKGIRKDQLLMLTKPDTRAVLYKLIKNGEYRISPPHIALIPKDNPGEFRTVYVNEPFDRIVLSIANDLLFELMPEMIHPRCKSYQKGIGCGNVVKQISKEICSYKTDGIIGWKADLSKYFDSVPIRYIDDVFDRIELKYGKSKLIDLIRDYYHSDIYFDENVDLKSSFQSLKQGCAVAAFLADAMLYNIDEKLSKLKGVYTRYSDDILFVGEDYQLAMDILKEELSVMEMKLNPKKVEYITHSNRFCFLGFSIKGEDISLSAKRIKTFADRIKECTIDKKDRTLSSALSKVNNFLYKGNGEHSWATQVLPIVTNTKDLNTLNCFVMDCLRAVQTKRFKIGGIGYSQVMKDGCILRGKGKNVTSNKSKTSKNIEGYNSILCMRNSMLFCRELYNTMVQSI